ncbi:hypothetical protein D3C81_1009290 [compost metagenome]
MAWNGDGPLPFCTFNRGQFQGVEQLLDLGWVHFHAKHLGDAFGAQGDRGYLWQVLLADRFNHRAGFAANDVQQQLGGALHGFAGQLRVDAALVAVRGIGVQAVGTGFTGDGDRLEEGAFEEQVAGFFGVHTAVLATHDAGDGQGAGVVGDYQGVGAQGNFLAVEQDELLALFGHAHADAAVDFGEVEGVHRLAEFEHHVVGDVDGSVDAAHVAAAQAFDHPQWGRLAQVDVADDAAQVAWAGSRGADFDRAHFVVGSRYGWHHRAGDRGVVQGADVAGQAGDGQAVAAVGGEADFDAGVVQAQVLANVFANRGVSRQFQQAVVLFADLQFGSRAQHAEGLDAAQLGLLDLEVAWQFGADHGERDLDAWAGVRGAAHDLEGFLAVAYLAHAQLVGVRVLFGGEDFAHDDAAELAGSGGNAVDFEAGHGQAGDQFVTGDLRVYPTAQPLFTEFHAVLLECASIGPSGIGQGTAGRYRRTDANR